MNQPVFHKIREGSLIWVNIEKNPQLRSNEVRGYFVKLIGIHHFPPTADRKYRGDSFERIEYRETEDGEIKEGYLHEITSF